MTFTLLDCLAALQKEGLVTSYNLGTLTENRVVHGLSFDNRTVQPGEVFVCKGAAFKEAYLVSALSLGALCYVSQTIYSVEAPYIAVHDIRLAMAVLAKAFYFEDAALVKKVGITGTKGKSTVSALLSAILDEYHLAMRGKRTALISSIRVFDGVVDEEAKLTTPEALDLWRYLANAGRSGLDYAVCEVSSQALKYHRTRGVDFDIAVFLNIGEDHISDVEHCDLEDYISSKLKIFENAKVACVNSASDKLERILSSAQEAECEIATFGFGESDTLYCSKIEYTEEGTLFWASWKGQEMKAYTITLSGRYNVENALAALAVAHLWGVPYESCEKGLSSAVVKGRGVHLYTQDRRVKVIVDYAHNKMSMEALFAYVKSVYPDEKTVTLFGAPGGKAKNRREDMGRSASRFSDCVILTEDDPAGEEVEEICREIASYMDGTAECEIICEREDAIKKGFSLVADGGVLLLCGKGAETTQKRKNGAEPYQGDLYFAKQAIEAYDAEALTVGF